MSGEEGRVAIGRPASATARRGPCPAPLEQAGEARLARETNKRQRATRRGVAHDRRRAAPAAAQLRGAGRRREELGPLFALVERAGAGELRLAEMAALFWHCLADRAGVSREAVGEAIAEAGLAACAPALRAVLGQILQGRNEGRG